MRIPSSSLAILFIALFYLGIDGHSHNWTRHDGTKGRGVIQWDIISYYSYLPATFIYGDATLGFLDDPPEGFKNDNKFWYLKLDNGNRLIATSMGMAYLYAPFFFMAHGLAPLFGEVRDGYDSIYQLFLVLGSLVYVILGFVVLRKLLRRVFTDRAAALTILAIGLGTNLFYYSTQEAAMAHGPSFFLIILYLALVIRWHENQTAVRTLLVGAVLGLLSLVRPSNILVLLLLLVYGVRSFRELINRIIFLIRRFHLVLLMLAAFIAVWIPQFLYWKAVTGHFIFNSYGPFGGRFFFGYPHVVESLFSYKKGWFVYVPVMFFAVCSIPLLHKRMSGLFWPVTVLLLVEIYVLSSWWSWWFGGGFGLRSYIDIYGIMAFPLAAGIEYAFQHKKRWIGLLYPAWIVILILFHQMNTWQYKRNIIHYNGMNREVYWKSFMRFKRPPDYWESLTLPDYTLARKGIYVFYHTGFDPSSLKVLGEEAGMKKLEADLQENRKLYREVQRYARREDIPLEDAVEEVTRRMYERMIDL